VEMLRFKPDEKYKVKVDEVEVFNGVGKSPTIKRKMFYLYEDGKLNSVHFSMESVNQLLYKNTNGKYGIIKEEHYEKI
jgi:hypothetical protein